MISVMGKYGGEDITVSEKSQVMKGEDFIARSEKGRVVNSSGWRFSGISITCSKVIR